MFHGRASLVQRRLANALRDFQDTHDLAVFDEGDAEELHSKKFLFESEDEEEALLKHIYTLFSENLLTKNPSRRYQILVTYSCNLRCLYCFQKGSRGNGSISPQQLERIFEIIDNTEAANEAELVEKELKSKETVISIAGGEPLQKRKDVRETVAAIIAYAQKNDYYYTITTNGTNLEDYISLFRESGHYPRDVQITLDGPKEIHDLRRVGISGQGSFDKIIRNIETGLEAGMRLSMRINLDLMNAGSLGEIAELIVSRGWHKVDGFSAYLAPVTDHSNVNDDYGWISEDKSIIEEILRHFRENPEIESIFNLKNFRGFEYVRRAALENEATTPTFWRCEAVLGQLIFDPSGTIYSCFEGSGKPDAIIGTYHPEFRLDAERAKAWRELNAYDCTYCKDCLYRFVCAGGCPWHMMHLQETECLPIAEEMELAWNHYADRFLQRLGLLQDVQAQ